MRRTFTLTLVCAALVGTGLIGAPREVISLARAGGGVAHDAVLLTAEGKFSEANRLLDEAGDELKNDTKLRALLGDQALKWAARQQGGEKIPGLLAARDHLAAAATGDPTATDAARGALEAAGELIDLQLAAKQTERAVAHADWLVTTGEAFLAAGTDTPEIRLALSAALRRRAKMGHKVNDFDRIVADYQRSADLLVTCAEATKKPAETLGDAAQVYLDLARFVADGRPIEEEKRDEEALEKAIATARLACETKGAERAQFTTHLIALREAHRAKLAGDHGHPYMAELGTRDGIDGLNVQIPRAEGWKRLDSSGEWQLIFERKVGDDDTAVQIMLSARRSSETTLNKKWDQIEDVAKARFEDQKANDFQDLAKAVEAEQIDTGKKGPEIWHFELTGTTGGRTRRVAEWMMLRSKKDKVTYQIRLIDWRKSPDLEEPDIVEFLRLALDRPDPEADDDKGKGKGKKKR